MDTTKAVRARPDTNRSSGETSVRPFLVLARVSNLPTVWSNCLAAWLLAGGRSWSRFILVGLGATLLYTGGMFLNDAFDQDFDRRYRPERPIVSGLVSPKTVWALSLAWLGIGWAIFLWLGTASAAMAFLLVAAIVLYDWMHKRTVLSPVLMACCRFLLYLLAGVAAGGGRDTALLWCAGALAAYIVGLSYLARGESTGLRFCRWTLVLLFVPAVVALFLPTSIRTLTFVTVAAVQVGWTLWCLWKEKSGMLLALPRGVAGLLAGIAFVDWLAVAGYGSAGAFLLLFGAALTLQRVAPAT